MFVFAVLLIFASIVFCRFYVIVLQSGCKDRHNFENGKIKMQKKVHENEKILLVLDF